ncbi:MAG: uracil-DNA glycosylase, partial [Bacteroidales bacterium]
VSELEKLRNEIESCTKSALCQNRINAIFGEGRMDSRLFLIGEAPGRKEDLTGRPFIGWSGHLLDKILADCGFNRDEHLFIGNIVKCRPPENRIPLSEDVQ